MPLFQGGRLNLAVYNQMEMLIMFWGKVHASRHGFALFSLPNPTLTSVFDPSNWIFDDDIDQMSDDEAVLAHGGEVGEEGGGGRDVGPSGFSPSCEGGSDLRSGSDAIPLEEEDYTPPLTRSHIKVGSSSFDATHFY